MSRLLAWIDRLPLLSVIVLGVAFGLAPFIPEPHLVEKLRMLWNGALVRPIDIFDLFFHGLPVALMAVRLARLARK